MESTHSLVGLLIFVLIIFVLVFVAIWVIDQTLPPPIRMPAKVVVGLIALIAILYRLVPLT
jgi:hypothetical protein